MENGIFSVKAFLDALGIGDRFWTLVHYAGQGPICVEGPLVVTGFVGEENEESKVVVCSQTSTGTTIEERHISDLTNQWHGVFLSQKLAINYLNGRIMEYMIDPTLIAELERDREFNQRLSDDGF